MDAKALAQDRVLGAKQQLLDLSHRIHAEPELGFEEERASTWVAEALAGAGFQVERGVYDLPTAIAARTGPGPLRPSAAASCRARASRYASGRLNPPTPGVSSPTKR
jgi:metal-dependent amidase/aminoacylase/carboxypeptidase family protein